MYLKSIEAIGFKSFADKIEVNFNKDITAIVGPNGSGKSNITDAIRWVLGEQSTRYLRASNMQDVIFAGTQTRKSMNMAQVSLTFDNTDASLPMDFSEIEISRRIYRSGEGEYFINKKNCRLKDIYNLFMDTGVGKGSLFVIGQNKVDEILNGRADEKRILIEDLAGIIRYKQRKMESLQRLEKIQENILRISDIKIELENNLIDIKNEAEKTREYNRIYQDYRTKSLILAVYNYNVCEKQLEQAREKLTEYVKIQEEQKEELAHLEMSQSSNNQDVEDVQSKYVKINNEITELVALREQTAGNILLLKEKIEHIQTQQNELVNNKEKLISICDEIKNKNIFELSAQQLQYKEEYLHLESEHKKLLEEYGLLTEEHNKVANIHLQLQEKVNVNLNAFIDSKNKVVYLERELQQTNSRIEQQKGLLDEYSIKLNSFNEQIIYLSSRTKDLTIENQKIQPQLIEYEQEEIRIQNKIKEQQLVVDRVDKEITKLNNDTIILERLQATYQGFGTGIKNVLMARESWRAGIVGAVAELVDVPRAYIVAIETALGGSAQHIVTENEETAKLAVAYLKKGKMGRATFLPKTNIKSYNTQNQAIISGQGFIGMADSLVTIKSGLEEILRFLLGRIIVVDNIDNALVIARKYDYKYRIVTLDGEVINVGGSLTGGIVDKAQPGFLVREEEMKNNKKRIAKMQDERYELSMVVNDFEEQIYSIQKSFKIGSECLQNNNIALRKLEVEEQHLNDMITQLQGQISKINQEINTYKKDYELMFREKIDTENLATSLQADKDAHSHDIKTLLDRVQRLQVDKENKNDLVNRIYNKLSITKQSFSYVTERIEEAKENLENTKKEIVALEVKYDNNVEQVNNAKQDLLNAELKEQGLTLQRQALNNRLIEITKIRESIFSTQREIQNKLKERNSIQNANERALSKAQSIVKERQMQIEGIESSILEKYQADMEEANSYYSNEIDIKQVKIDVADIKEQIQELGLINPKAIQEFEQAMEKVAFLDKQYNDLQIAREDLDKIISEINKAMISRFKEAFIELNSHFNNTYKDLFGGGEARLELVDESDWLNSGVDIFVRPHGKKVLSMNALSGGERSLTVIALLFAILSMKKTAFCVLDEIDAPLDEANLHRFKEFLIKYGEETQFIIVTHRKQSMQIANNLYGVTMQEAGVSKVLSVHVNDMMEEV